MVVVNSRSVQVWCLLLPAPPLDPLCCILSSEHVFRQGEHWACEKPRVPREGVLGAGEQTSDNSEARARGRKWIYNLRKRDSLWKEGWKPLLKEAGWKEVVWVKIKTIFMRRREGCAKRETGENNCHHLPSMCQPLQLLFYTYGPKSHKALLGRFPVSCRCSTGEGI